METKTKKPGTTIILMGSVIMTVILTQMDLDKMKPAKIGLLCCVALFIGCGFYANYAARKKVGKQ
ncbi:hypothetical protein [Flavobacterium sp.]|uniref:hypothetical protein n=1 Tax=Flavobacterium sp. TaxID=239 RepID=UPI0026021B75|nr:hypothetical protein [Flavobacterium sp.]